MKSFPVHLVLYVFFVLFVLFKGSLTPLPAQTPSTPAPKQEAYDSWMLAKAGNVPGPDRIQVPAGFTTEVVRIAAPDEDSWVGMTFDAKGRVIIAKETKGLLRLTLDGARVSSVERINDDLLECRGLLWAHDSLYANANNTKGLYRLRDSDGDDRFDDVRLILRTEGGVGHGRNHLRLGPDGFIYVVHGDDPEPTDAQLAPESPYRNYGEDRLLPGRRPAGRTNVARTGHVLRLDAEGKNVVRLCGGLRNPLDLDFNRDGELFVYDADMEWDTGLAWYRPTRVLHIVSGGEYGWRHELSWALGADDNLPTVCDIGLGSPTGVTFGYAAQFPHKYREAFFIADWAYGRILAIHLQPEGASYRGIAETFVAGRPLNVTDVVIGPDGAMYFITGGRRTQSALYRVRYTGRESTAPAPPAEDPANRAARELRHELEKYHGKPIEGGVAKAFTYLAHPDRSVRFAARVALEAQPFGEWRERALRSAIPGAWIAFARLCNDDDDRYVLLRRLATVDTRALREADRLQFLRAIELALVRLGAVDKVVEGKLETALRAALAPLFPSNDRELNRELCRHLIWLHDESVVPKTLALLTDTLPTEDRTFYLFVLRIAKNGWDAAARRSWFESLRKAENYAGGRLYFELLQRTRNEFAATLTNEQKRELGDLLQPAKMPAPVVPPGAGKFVRAWQPQDFADDLRQPLHGRNFAAGQKAFAQALCATCHRFGAADAAPGAVVGPDLTNVGARFGPDALLFHTIEPSVIIDDKYRLAEAPNLSPMPQGLLNALEREQILDLLAYLTSGGDAGNAVFR